jgi:hypothetical protein
MSKFIWTILQKIYFFQAKEVIYVTIYLLQRVFCCEEWCYLQKVVDRR